MPITPENDPLDVRDEPQNTDGPPSATAGGMPDAVRAPRWTPPVPGSRRRPLVPRWAYFAGGGLVALALLVTGLVIWSAQLGLVRVPSLEGMDRTTALARAQEAGLGLRIGDRLFSSTVPAGEVVSQTPVAGLKVQEGTVVVVALSAGTEDFPMPDVTGMTVDAARRLLRDRGLTVDVATVASDRAQGTVVETFPSPGVTVATGDTVRLSVAAGSGTGGALLPSDLTGKSFVLDPVPMPSGVTADTTMDVARRLRALLEASGARVTVTREVTDSGDSLSTASRARRAKEASATALVGFTVGQSGQAGLVVLSVPATTTTQSFYIASAALSTALTDALKTAGRVVTTAPSGEDIILTGSGLPAVRLRLGSVASPDDKLLFTDPQWADDVARSVYRAIASVYGSK